jgi:hypothetical protein
VVNDRGPLRLPGRAAVRQTARIAEAAGIAIGLASACTPTLTDETALVSTPRLLAVQAEPAESRAGGTFGLTALYVGPQGPADASSIDWAICRLPKPLGDPGPINPSCFVEASSQLVSLGEGESVQGTVPPDSCQLFGPDSPPPQPGQPSARPTDPDSTGGFYLPVRILAGGQWSAMLDRITCPPAGLTQQVFSALSTGYQPNVNPVVASLAIADTDGGTTVIAPDVPGAQPSISVAASQRVSLVASWPSCPGTPTPCGGAETYLYVDPSTKQIATRRESMVASWYATAGQFDLDRTGRDEGDPTAYAMNGWTAPGAPGVTYLWVVLRDSRGGVGWGSYRLEVR